MESNVSEVEILIGLVLGTVLKFTVSWWMRRRREKFFEKVGRVSKLYFYPVKSCKGIQLTEGECTKYGVKFNGVYDRNFVMVKPNGNFVHQRQYPKMALISVEDKGDKLEFNAPGQSPISVPKWASLNKKELKKVELFFNETMEGQDCGDEIGKWISDYLGEQGFRLLRYVEGMKQRNIHGFTWKVWDVATVDGDTAMYTDAAAYLLINKASLDDLNARMERSFTEVTFRPNIFIEGPGPFDEDNWSEIKIGDEVRMRCTDACNRCSLTTVDPEKGVISKDGEPLKTLRKYRCDAEKYGREFKESPVFGINTSVDVLGKVKIGDPVYAVRKR